MPTGKPQSTIYGPVPTEDLQMANKVYVDTSGFFPSEIIKLIDEVRASDDTLTNDSVLTAELEATSLYSILVAMYADSDSTADFKYTHVYSGTVIDAGFTNDISGFLTTALGGSQAMTSATWPFIRYSRCFIQTNAAGTYNFQWAQNTSNASNTTVKAGSRLYIQKLT